MAERTTRERRVKLALLLMVANRLSLDAKPCSVMGLKALCRLAAAFAAIAATWALSGAYAKTALHCENGLHRWDLREQRYLTPKKGCAVRDGSAGTN